MFEAKDQRKPTVQIIHCEAMHADEANRSANVMAYCTLNLREKPPPGPTLHPTTHNVFKGTHSRLDAVFGDLFIGAFL